MLALNINSASVVFLLSEEVVVLADQGFLLDNYILWLVFFERGCFMQDLGLLELCFVVWVLKVIEKILTNVIFVFNVKYRVKFFVSP